MSIGRVIAFDPGSKRIGVAISDPLRIVASPLTVIDAHDPWQEIEALLEEYGPTVIVVGLPVSLSGDEGPAAVRARAFGEELERRTGRPIEWVDERFTTKTAEEALIEGGVRRRERRLSVDKVAAAVILQHYLTSRS
jgi:putative Holliday junction resolvase